MNNHRNTGTPHVQSPPLKNQKSIIIAFLIIALSSSACSVLDNLACTILKGGRYTFDNQGFYCDTSQSEQENAEADEKEESPSSTSGLAACLVDPADYDLWLSEMRDGTSGSKRSCNARGNISNTGEKEFMFAVYRVNHYGAEETFGERWMGAGYQSLTPGESAEYGRFHRCTGGNCGEGEWFYIEKISLLYKTDECLALAFAQEDKIPETIIQIDDPCSW